VPNDPRYVLEKLFLAVDALVSHSGRVQERLVAAAIAFLPAKPDDLPYEDLRKKFAGIKDDLAFQPASGNEGMIAATLKITSDEDASAIARRIFNLYCDLDERLREK
jgi:hypothetical protein